MKTEPTTALSIRQPWAYLIIHGGKDIENREWPTKFRGRMLVHASKTMTKADYEACALYCSGLPDGTLPNDFWFPTFEDLKAQCGGIVGEVEVIDCVRQSESPWFCGQYGFVLRDPKVLPFRAYKGRLGFFPVQEGAPS